MIASIMYVDYDACFNDYFYIFIHFEINIIFLFCIKILTFLSYYYLKIILNFQNYYFNFLILFKIMHFSFKNISL